VALGPAVVLAVALAPASAAAESKQECAASYVAGQVARKEGRLRDARAKFAVCASAACPAALQRDCKPWSGQLDGEIPTLAVTVVDATGGELSTAAVTIDDTALPAAGAVALDPGDHVVRVEASKLKPSEQRVTLAVGERRQLRVRLGAAEPVAAAPDRRATPIAPIVLGAIGAVGLGVFAGLGATGNAKRSDLDALGCKPHCQPSDVSAAKSLYLGADIALGVGLASIAGGAVALIVHVTASSSAPPDSSVGFVATPGGGGLGVRF
jgi:hypothetical protein